MDVPSVAPYPAEMTDQLLPVGTRVPVPGPGGSTYVVRQWRPGEDMPFADCTAVGLDTETEPIERGSPSRPVSLQIAGDRTAEMVIVHPRHYQAALDYINTSYPDIAWVFFNAPFDCRVLGWPGEPLWTALHRDLLVDMEIRSILYYLQEGTYIGGMNLGELSRRALSWELRKDDGTQLSFRQGVELNLEQISYAAQDSIATVQSFAKMPEALPTEALNIRGYFALSDASWRGLRVDPDERERLSKQFLDEQVRLYGLLQIFGIAPGDPLIEGSSAPSGIQARKQELLIGLEAQYQQPDAEKPFKLPRTESGNISTEKKTLDLALISSGIQVPTWMELSRSYDHARKIRKTYLNPAMIGADGKVHPRFSPLMRTGRTSASKPNTQNLTRAGGIRGIYIPEDGFLFLATDFNQLELCSLAQSCWTRFGRSKMRELINAGVDLHYWFGDIIAVKAGRIFTPEEADSDERKEFRSRAKAANFGYPGGLGAATFVAYARNYGVQITIEQAAELRELWLESFPEMKEHLSPVVDDYWTSRNIQVWLSQHRMAPQYRIRTLNELTYYLQEQEWESEDIFKATSGLAAYECRLVSGRLKRNCTFCAAANMQFQGLAADGAKIGLWEGYLQGWRIVNFVHDEVIQEVPIVWTPEQHTLFRDNVEHTLCSCMMQVLPDVAVRAESVLMPRWYKEAKPFTDEDGYLMVWTPEEAARRKAEKEAAKVAAATAV
jgi:hypothetical protein